MEPSQLQRHAHVGIDPGFTGALAVIRPDGAVDIHNTPTYRVKVGAKMRRLYDEPAMVKIIREICRAHPTVAATIEFVNARPARNKDGEPVAMGATAILQFGIGWGLWRGMLAAFRVPYKVVQPARWKAAVLVGVDKDDDDAEVAFAERLYPGQSLRGPRGGLMRGRSDALLIAHYGKQRAETDAIARLP